MSRIYLDTNIVISLVEDETPRCAALRRRLAELAGPEGSHIVSDLVRLECRVKPLAQRDRLLLQAYDLFFAALGVTVVGLTSGVCDGAAEIRARRRYATPDALHLAAAIEASCDLFVTADARLAGCPDLPVTVLAPEGLAGCEGEAEQPAPGDR
jgi:predicted nucleic acid-binding protein